LSQIIVVFKSEMTRQDAEISILIHSSWATAASRPSALLFSAYCAGETAAVCSATMDSSERPQRTTKLAADSSWSTLMPTTFSGTGQKRGRKPGQVDEAPRKKKGGAATFARAWNLGDSTSAIVQEHQAHWAKVTKYLQFVKPVLEGLKSMIATDRKSVRSLLDELESRSKAQKRQH
jgi:hypothetical protein